MAEIARYSDVDTRRFGKRIYRASLERVADVQALESLAREERVEMMIARCPAGHIQIVHALESASYSLMDTLVDYAGLTQAFEDATWQHVVREAEPGDRDALAEIAFDAFANYSGHYHADPRLDPKLATEGYVDWCLSSLGREDFTVWIAVDDPDRMGFLTVGHEDGFSRVVLNGVASRYQRRGVYDSLLKAAGQALFRRGVSNVRASTHLATVAPQRAWIRHGMMLATAHYTFHKWFVS